jgi:hypothetical protein
MVTDANELDYPPEYGREENMGLGVAYASMRQWLFPRAFQIARLTVPAEDNPQLNDPHALADDGRGQASALPNSSDGVDEATFLAAVATGLWRIQRKIQPLGETAESAEFRAVCRHVESTLDVLASREIEIRDDAGTEYVAGMALKVVAFQPTEGLEQETICETIRPSVFYKGTLIQRGEVIVGTPGGQHGEAGVPATGVVAQPNGAAAKSIPTQDDPTQNDPAGNKLTGGPERQERNT